MRLITTIRATAPIYRDLGISSSSFFFFFPSSSFKVTANECEVKPGNQIGGSHTQMCFLGCNWYMNSAVWTDEAPIP